MRAALLQVATRHIFNMSVSHAMSIHQTSSAAVRATYGFRRADGCSGSAIKGVKVLSTPPRHLHGEEGRAGDTSQNGAGGGFAILSAGYDQRLSIWRPLPQTLHIPQTHVSQSLQESRETTRVSPTQSGQDVDRPSVKSADIAQQRDSLLEWRAGMAVHVGDVCALDAITICTQGPYQDSCTADTTCDPLRSADSRSDGNCASHSTDAQTKSIAHATEVNRSEIAIVVVGEGYQVFSAALQNHNYIDGGGCQ